MRMTNEIWSQWLFLIFPSSSHTKIRPTVLKTNFLQCTRNNHVGDSRSAGARGGGVPRAAAEGVPALYRPAAGVLPPVRVLPRGVPARH